VVSGKTVLVITDSLTAQRVDSGTSAAKAVFEIEALNATLEALLHPKPGFFRSR
jgi:hypothetical protein